MSLRETLPDKDIPMRTPLPHGGMTGVTNPRRRDAAGPPLFGLPPPATTDRA
jgi:hypothetical protein